MSIPRSVQVLVFAAIGTAVGVVAVGHAETAGTVLRGKAAFGSWHDDAPGKRRHITADALPEPYASPSRSNGVRVVARPRNAELKVPAGFEVKQFAAGLSGPRTLRVAPNGDIFVAETGAGRIRILRPAGNGAGALVKHIGIEAFRPEEPNVAFQPRLHRFQTGKLAGKHSFALLQHGARLQTVIAGLEVVGEIAADADGEQRKEEGSEPHGFAA